MASARLLSHMLRAPALTGSVVPSSAHLARAMARSSAQAQFVIELGAGTGPVTRALAQQHPAERLLVVELQPALAQSLRKHFPQLHIEQATAKQVLDAGAYAGPVALVSSLPFRSLPPSVRAETIDSVASFLVRHPGSWLVQFTYQPRAPFAAPEGFVWHQVQQVWRNLPPAGVWLLRQA